MITTILNVLEDRRQYTSCFDASSVVHKREKGALFCFVKQKQVGESFNHVGKWIHCWLTKTTTTHTHTQI